MTFTIAAPRLSRMHSSSNTFLIFVDVRNEKIDRGPRCGGFMADGPTKAPNSRRAASNLSELPQMHRRRLKSEILLTRIPRSAPALAYDQIELLRS